MKEIIPFEDWSKIELRVGKIIEIGGIDGADKLWKLTIDVGEFGKRIVCAGLKQHYSKGDLIDKKVILFMNLAMRKMKGIESQGMVLASVSKDEKIVRLIEPDGEIEVGSCVR